jgi:hypothetical protein
MGGPERLAANELAGILDEIAESVPEQDRAWPSRSRKLLDPAAAGHSTIWPASDDDKLLALMKEHYRSSDMLEINDGWRMRVEQGRAGGRQACRAGWMFPDPTSNGATMGQVSQAAAIGNVSRLFFDFFLVSNVSEEDGDQGCQFQPVPGRSYRQRSGFPFYLFVDADSRIVGAQIVGYMFVELFVAPGITDDLYRVLLNATAHELARQAE